MSDTALNQEVADLEVADFDFDGDLKFSFLTDSNISMMANQEMGPSLESKQYILSILAPYHLGKLQILMGIKIGHACKC